MHSQARLEFQAYGNRRETNKSARFPASASFSCSNFLNSQHVRCHGEQNYTGGKTDVCAPYAYVMQHYRIWPTFRTNLLGILIVSMESSETDQRNCHKGTG